MLAESFFKKTSFIKKIVEQSQNERIKSLIKNKMNEENLLRLIYGSFILERCH